MPNMALRVGGMMLTLTALVLALALGVGLELMTAL